MLKLDISGEVDIAATLSELSNAAKTKIGVEAVVNALTPVVDAAQRNAKRSEDTGNLRRSIGFRVRPYKRTGNIVAIIGPRRGFKVPDPSGRGYRVASKYGHLVEFGHMAKGGKHIAAKAFMRPAFDSQKAEAQRRMAKVLGQKIELAAKKIARRKAKKGR